MNNHVYRLNRSFALAECLRDAVGAAQARGDLPVADEVRGELVELLARTVYDLSRRFTRFPPTSEEARSGLFVQFADICRRQIRPAQWHTTVRCLDPNRLADDAVLAVLKAYRTVMKEEKKA